MADRGVWVAGLGIAGNVRRLMYQSLIWAAVASDDAGRMGPAFDAEGRKGLADALIDGVRRNLELGRNLLGRQELIDQQQAVELSAAQARDPLRHLITNVHIRCFTMCVPQIVPIAQC